MLLALSAGEPSGSGISILCAVGAGQWPGCRDFFGNGPSGSLLPRALSKGLVLSFESNEGVRGGKSPGTSGIRGSTLDAASDFELLRAHARGVRHAFAVLLRRHQDHLWQTAMRISYTREDAADALQDALLSAHRNAGTFRAEAEVRSWLHTIVVNACLDRLRRNKTRPSIAVAPEHLAEIPTERDTYAHVEVAITLDHALFELPPEQRTALVAVDMEGYTVAEAAALLGVPEGTIKSRCARARQRLQKSLEFLRDPGNRR